MKINKKGFTLIELLVSISILGIIMVSVFLIFTIAADLNNKVDISRSMQENIKDIIENIAEDIRKNGIVGVNNDIINSNCNNPTGLLYNSGTKLCVGSSSYYLAKFNGTIWIRIGDYSECDEKTQCFLVKNDGTNINQLSNSWVDFKNLYFYVSDYGSKKVSINFKLQPSTIKGIKPELIKENKIIFQTTLSERLYNDY